MNKKTKFSITVFFVTAFFPLLYGQQNGSYTDPRDDKVYKTVKIDEQEWMAENLAFKTADGCWVYDNVNDYLKTHGYLYNWKAATNACPEGWHLPSIQDWWSLSGYLGGDEVSGGKLKEEGTSSWKSPNVDATNTSGFTALSSGRSGDINLEYLGSMTYFWTNVDDDDVTSWCASLSSSSGALSIYPTDKRDGYSVRCIKNSDKVEERFEFW